MIWVRQVTRFAYEHGSDPNLLTNVTDPFGRFATLGYDAQGRLASITDAAGMTSTFTYGNSDFIVAMTTPYGTTTFRHEPSSATTALFRAIEATDPVGGRERLEFHLQNNAFPETAPSGEVPSPCSDPPDRSSGRRILLLVSNRKGARVDVDVPSYCRVLSRRYLTSCD